MLDRATLDLLAKNVEKLRAKLNSSNTGPKSKDDMEFYMTTAWALDPLGWKEPSSAQEADKIAKAKLWNYSRCRNLCKSRNIEYSFFVPDENFQGPEGLVKGINYVLQRKHLSLKKFSLSQVRRDELYTPDDYAHTVMCHVPVDLENSVTCHVEVACLNGPTVTAAHTCDMMLELKYFQAEIIEGVDEYLGTADKLMDPTVRIICRLSKIIYDTIYGARYTKDFIISHSTAAWSNI